MGTSGGQVLKVRSSHELQLLDAEQNKNLSLED